MIALSHAPGTRTCGLCLRRGPHGRGGAGSPQEPPSAPAPAGASADILDDPDQLVHPVALLAGETDEIPGLGDDRSVLGCGDDGDATPSWSPSGLWTAVSDLQRKSFLDYARGTIRIVDVDTKRGRFVRGEALLNRIEDLSWSTAGILGSERVTN